MTNRQYETADFSSIGNIWLYKKSDTIIAFLTSTIYMDTAKKLCKQQYFDQEQNFSSRRKSWEKEKYRKRKKNRQWTRTRILYLYGTKYNFDSVET